MRKGDGTLHLLRARRGVPHRQVGARLPPRWSTSRAPTTTAPSRACAPACRRPASASRPGYPDYVLHTMVRVMRGGEEVKISKRAGSYVTLRDLIEWTSTDAVRFFLLSAQARHRIHLRHRPGAGAEQRQPGLLRAVRACAHLLGAGGLGRRCGSAGGRRPVAAAEPGRAGADAAAGQVPRHAHRRGQGFRAARRHLLPARTGRQRTTATTTPSASWSTTNR